MSDQPRDSLGWCYTGAPKEGEDARCIVWLQDRHGMEWCGPCLPRQRRRMAERQRADIGARAVLDAATGKAAAPMESREVDA
ncbi:MAG: hypothetical protein IPO08_24785 [Xanthomonadales bacterium]|nr:hypothetical protein [Xanthomonadales bacterium]